MLRPSVAFLALLSLLLPAALYAQLGSEAGRFAITSYSSKSYGASPQDWAIAQDARGFMYFGNTDGILEYDGSSWRKIPIPNGIVRVLATSPSGDIYVGGDGVIGRLRSDREGKMQFASLADRIPPADRQFGIVRNVLAVSDSVYFISRARLFRFREDGKVDVWSTQGGFRKVLFSAHGRIYLSSLKNVPLALENGRLTRCAWSPALDHPLVAGLEWGDSILVASPEQIYRVRNDALEPFPTQANDYLSEHKVSLLSRLPNGDLVIGTGSGGFVVLELKTHSVRIVTQTSGLPSNSVTSFFATTQENVWVSTNAGLAHFVPSLTKFSELQGINGNVYSIGRDSGTLYVGTTAGLYKLHSAVAGEPVLEAVTPISSAVTVWTIVHIGDSSLIGTDSGIYSTSAVGIKQVLPIGMVLDLRVSQHDPEVFFAAGREGVFLLRREGANWRMVSQVKGEGQDFRTVAEDDNGQIWATTSVDIWRFNFGSSPVKAERFDKTNGVPDGWKSAFRFRNHVVFGTGKGLLRFAEDQHRFVPDPELGTQFSDGTRGVSLLKEDNQHNVWVSGKGYHGFLRAFSPGSLDWIEMPLLASGIEEIWALNVDADGTVWASGEEQTLFRWKPETAPHFDGQNFRVFVRQLSVAESKITLFGGNGPQPAALKIPYRENALRFEFAAPFYEAPEAVQYQFRLDKNDHEWSPWTTEAHKDFTNLPPHNFTFRVRARSPHGVIAPDATLSFRVLPPWYRTWWSYCLYFIATLLLGWLIVRWRLKVLRAHNQHLEKVVLQRTLEVRTQRDQNEALLLNILPAPVAAELRDHGSVTPTIFEDVTVCFTDFVGFTLSSEKLSADRLVTALNEYFTAFDAIMTRYGLEKLKTIGDSYMFVSGLPERRASHSVDAVLAALEMLHASKLLANPDADTDWKMRVGLYSGPVVAGVVGKSKFAFDIWGNTVNLASRMESSGSPGRINLSASTCSHVGQFIDCEARGLVRIKEGRALEMHFATGVKPELLHGPLMNGVPKAFCDQYWATFSQLPRAFPAFLVQAEPALMGD